MILPATNNSTFISSQPKAESILPKVSEKLVMIQVDLHHVAYFRDNTSYDELKEALINKIFELKTKLDKITA